MVAGARSAVVEVVDGDVRVATLRLHADARPDLSVVDSIAPLALAARQLGWSIRLRDPCPGLTDLLKFVGLSEAVPVATPEASDRS